MSKFGKFIKSVVIIKMNACLVFTASLIIGVIVLSIKNHEAMPLVMIWQFLLISFACAIFQWFAFSEDVIKKLKYVYRRFVFIIPFFVTLSGAAFLWNWFDTTQLIQWSIFIGLFILAYIGISIGLLIYFKSTGQKYNEKLEEYKASK